MHAGNGVISRWNNGRILKNWVAYAHVSALAVEMMVRRALELCICTMQEL